MWLIFWDECYADEFNIFGIEVINDECRNELIRRLEKAIEEDLDDYREYYFGTNEWIDYKYSDILDKLKHAKRLTDIEYKVIEDLQLCGGQTFLWKAEEELDEDGIK